VNAVLRMLRNPLHLLTVVVLAWAVGTFLLLPNVTLLGTVFADGSGAPSLRSFGRLLGSERAMTALWHSFALAAVLSVTVNVVGVFIVLVTCFYVVRGARLLWWGYASTLVCGGIVLVFGHRQVYGPQGLVTRVLEQVVPGLDGDWFSGFPAVLVVMTFATTGNHLLFLSAAVARIDRETVEAARMLGASELRVLVRIVLPVLRPMLFAVTVLTFLGGLSALAAPQVLGGREFQTIAPLILAFASSPSSRDLAATLALLVGVVTIALLATLNRLERGGVYFSVSKVPAPLVKQRIANRATNAVVHAVAYLLWFAYALPPALVVLYSFTDAEAINAGSFGVDDLTLENYRAVLFTGSGLRPLLVSLGYGAAASVVVLVLMLFTARMVQRERNVLTRAIEYVLHVPWLLPTTMVALGLIVTFDRPQPTVLGHVLTGTSVLLGICYVIAKTPFTFRLLKAAFTAVPDNVEEAAAMLGAGPLRTFRQVLLPFVVPTAASVTALNFISLLDDYDAAVFLAHPLLQPLGLVIKSATSGETVSDSTALSFVYSTLLMAVSAVALAFVHGGTGRRGQRRSRRSTPRPGTSREGSPCSDKPGSRRSTTGSTTPSGVEAR
jgi:iron(III) transport system permease protein